MRAVVVGAGIGGLAAAIALERAGVETVVVERATAVREAGFGLVLAANAVTALDALGLREAVAARGRCVARAEIRDPRGRLLTEIPYARLGWKTYGILRSDLQQALLAAVPGERLRLGRECTGVESDGNVHVDGGGPLRGDLVVGADGIHSVVHRSLFGDERLRYGGHRAWRAGVAFEDDVIGDRFVEAWGVGGGFGFGPAGATRVYWYCFETVREDAPPRADPKSELLRRYGTWFDPVPRLIEATDPDAIEPTLTYDRRPRRDWGRGRVTLLGDAAHPMKPNIGQGAAQALEDAVVLADALTGASDPESGLREYERRRVRRANAVVRASRRAGRAAEVHTAAAAALRNTLMRALPTRVVVAQQRQLIDFDYRR